MQSKTDWAKLKSGGRVTASPDHPEADVRHIVRGIVRRGLKPQPPKAADEDRNTILISTSQNVVVAAIEGKLMSHEFPPREV